ncbi:MAG: NUDIX domain-containing protein [Absicoccus porci]|uniref:(deoxy)nucleoside triphosphate pyrophosphohydrolase n=1 Tax=Absicoccus porci TaxID=2486576 RepID=UPI00156866A1|nr:NUDIX domain-containing protein [Absicoccus porci]MCI6087577.1 NUDIX domain-containing protein [Absicoccus porci]MDD6459600.1 NUDIX domain-containing protein [Absicoccus porci]MDD7330586.1 NUDIX domain-containing protein [Absicoccus porci]MDY4738566.1 NUDIX domain-containing protein [Absicoccus porci]MEE1354370.1 NUDIX domain-containing protein [Absicoccus porci]
MIEVVCGALIQQGKVLIARRNYGSSKGMYEFPGGKVEKNETKEEALIREMKEELDIDIHTIQYLSESEDQQEYPFHLTCFLCFSNQVPKMIVHDDFIWTTPDHIYDHHFFKSDIGLVKALKKVWPYVSQNK